MDQNPCVILTAEKSETQRRPALFGGLLSPGGACLATTGAKRRLTLQTKERRAMPMNYVTYPDLVQIGIFIVALVGLCYTVFGKRK